MRLEDSFTQGIRTEYTDPIKKMPEYIPIPCSFSTVSEAPRNIASLSMNTHLASPDRCRYC
jgi:hypothetical protein